MNPLPLVYELSLEDLLSHMQAWDQPGYRARQVWHGLYQKLLNSAHEMTDLPAYLRERLAESLAFASLQGMVSARSRDGRTEKFLLTLQDGLSVEAVLMRYDRRQTACISTQVGCAMGCPFCATGQMGFKRNLTAGEIIEQVLFLARWLAQSEEKLSNIVVMGMGEPFHNYEAVMRAIDCLNHPQGLCLGARRMTLSTVGLVPGIGRFTQERRQVNLAVSLHAATDELRDRMVPINRRYPLAVLMQSCRAYVENTGRRITFEWALVEDLNDSRDQAQALAHLMAGLTCHVNLIPLNPTSGYAGRGSSRERAAGFAAVLRNQGIPCTVRLRRGVGIAAGCGQLATAARSAEGPGQPGSSLP